MYSLLARQMKSGLQCASHGAPRTLSGFNSISGNASQKRKMSCGVMKGKYEDGKIVDPGHLAILFSEPDKNRLKAAGYIHQAMGGAGNRKVTYDWKKRTQVNEHIGGAKTNVSFNSVLRPLTTVEEDGKKYHYEIVIGNLTDDGAKATADFENKIKNSETRYALGATVGTWEMLDQTTGENKIFPTVNCIGLGVLYLEYLSGEKIDVPPRATPDRAYELILEAVPRIQNALVKKGFIHSS